MSNMLENLNSFIKSPDSFYSYITVTEEEKLPANNTSNESKEPETQASAQEKTQNPPTLDADTLRRSKNHCSMCTLHNKCDYYQTINSPLYAHTVTPMDTLQCESFCITFKAPTPPPAPVELKKEESNEETSSKDSANQEVACFNEVKVISNTESKINVSVDAINFSFRQLSKLERKIFEVLVLINAFIAFMLFLTRSSNISTILFYTAIYSALFFMLTKVIIREHVQSIRENYNDFSK